MTAYTASATVGRYLTGEISTLIKPRKPNISKRAILFAHGAGSNGMRAVDSTSLPNGSKILAALALGDDATRPGTVILSGDFGGIETWGNDACLASMEAAWAWLQASGLCATDKIILMGESMGMQSCSRFAAEHPTQVAGMNVWIPAVNGEDFRNRNILGLQDAVNTAWGLAAGTSESTGGPSIPTRGRPLDRVAEVAAIPTHLWYSTADTVATPDWVDQYAAARANVTKHILSTTLGHGDPVFAGTDVPTLQAFVHSVGG